MTYPIIELLFVVANTSASLFDSQMRCTKCFIQVSKKQK